METNVEIEQVNQTRVLAFSQVTFMFLVAPQACCVSCVVDPASPWLELPNVEKKDVGGIDIREIRLPGAGVILLIPPLMVASPASRRELALRLAGEKDSGENGSLEDIELTSSTEANGSTDGVVKPLQKGSSTDPTLSKIPSLQVQMLEQGGKWQSDFPLNTQSPIPVETELFKGQILVIIRPPNPEDDPYWNERIFSKKKRKIIVQVQGKFKYEPEGVIYAGAEISEPMKLGLITRGLASVLLRLVDSFNSNVHSSFGDAKERAHIVVPAYTFFERIVVTPPGETPPPMTEVFPESAESIAARQKKPSLGQWNTSDTYSLSFYSMYIDLPTWKLVSLPVSGDISLKTFWGNSLLRICMYEKDNRNKRHLHDLNKYAFAVQVGYRLASLSLCFYHSCRIVSLTLTQSCVS